MPNLPNEREYRAMPLMAGVEESENEYLVRGYATTFDDPYKLYSFEGVDFYEVVDRNAIDEKTDMSDVIFQFDHQGMVFARMSNGTLNLSTDGHGLEVNADLSKTADARNMRENIASGMVREMSWAFVVDGQEYDKETHTRKITHIKKIYDVSAVSIPANPNTYIAARSFIDGEIEKELQELELREAKKQKLRILLEV